MYELHLIRGSGGPEWEPKSQLVQPEMLLENTSPALEDIKVAGRCYGGE